MNRRTASCLPPSGDLSSTKKYCSKHSGKKANSISLGHRGKNASYTQHGKAPRMRVSL